MTTSDQTPVLVAQEQATQPTTQTDVAIKPVPGLRVTPVQQLDHGAASQSPCQRTWTRKFSIAIKTTGIIAFLLSCVALWPAITSASDTKRATLLAEWTSMKDFIEFCESHALDTPDCLKARNTTLRPPPVYSRVWPRSAFKLAASMKPDYSDLQEVGIAIMFFSFIFLVVVFTRVSSRGQLVRRRFAPKNGGELCLPLYLTLRALHVPQYLCRWHRHKASLRQADDDERFRSDTSFIRDSRTLELALETGLRARKLGRIGRRRRHERSERLARLRVKAHHIDELEDSSSDETCVDGRDDPARRLRRRVKRAWS
ncbi:hypothetical protein QBC46DRAFT_119122 [Diplogelasinospora grovesii]|uniref:Transmembrane protein n=1 Tax=Diplogelasinospora grovesii TaxID=303347 RepID=A0AAN6N9W9_9PEZI|nr:hypothetical protein QBC46DRAFT_119122 [Diplogelasinospora grovesii]